MKTKNIPEVRTAQTQVKKPVEKMVEKKIEAPIVEKAEIPITVKEELAPSTETVEPEKNRYDYHEINSAPRNGTLIIVSENGTDKGEIAFWKKTRAFANATHRWEETGFFVSNITNLPLSFKPKFWRIKTLYEI
jgi:hypothetical protein